MIIDFIFNILNLLLLITAIVYIFYKYLIKNILKAFNEDKSNIEFLYDQNKDLDIFEKKLDQSILEQDVAGKELTLKIEKWKHYVDQELEMKTKEYDNNYKQIKDKLQIQYNNYQNGKIQEQILPNLLDNLELEVNSYFKNQDNVNKYFDNIFKNKLKLEDHEQ